MAEEGNDGGISRMDLNLYLGLPRSSRRRVLDLGSDLALNSISLPASSSTEESCAEAPMDLGRGSGGASEPSDAHAPFSPPRFSFAPDISPPIDDPSTPVHSPYDPSYDPIGSSYIPIEQEVVHEDIEAPTIATYSPSHAAPQPLPHIEDAHEAPYLPYTAVEESLVLGVEPYAPYSPQEALLASSQPLRQSSGGDFTLQGAEDAVDSDGFLVRNNGSSSRQELLQYPHFQFNRIVELNNQTRLRRFRSSLPYVGNRTQRPNFPHTPTTHLPARLLQEISGKNKSAAGLNASESSDGESDGKSKGSSNFECNICLDLAEEPVVTSCGHLFCWPCLYQWLNIHSEHKECPVCKGEVVETNITPIYGRGTSSETSNEKKIANEGDSDLKIPPRPRGNRFESFRQQIRHRRLGEGISSSWRHLVDEGMWQLTGFESPTVQEMLDLGRHRILSRLRAMRTVHREDAGLERSLTTGEPSTTPRSSSQDPPLNNNTPGTILRDDVWPRFSHYGFTNTDRWTALTTDLTRVVERFASGRGPASTAASPVNPTEQQNVRNVGTFVADQASASSTMAVIEGEVSVPDISAAGPSSAGPSRSLRRSARGSVSSSSLDLDGGGGALRGRKRRRLN